MENKMTKEEALELLKKEEENRMKEFNEKLQNLLKEYNVTLQVTQQIIVAPAQR